MVKDRTLSSSDQEQDQVVYHFYLTWYCKVCMAVMQEEEIKCVQIRKEEVLTDDLVLNIENLKECVHTAKKTIRTNTWVCQGGRMWDQGTKVNGVFFYISNEQSANKIPFIIASKEIKYLEFWQKKCKTCILKTKKCNWKKPKKTSIKWKTSHVYRLEELILSESNIPKLIYRVNAIIIKISATFLAETAKLILKFIQKCMGPRIAKTILVREEQSWSTNISWFLNIK